MKRLFILYVVGMITVVSGYAQFPYTFFNSGNQQLVEQAVMPGLFIVKQTYVIRDSLGNDFGLNNRLEFGTSYSVGIKVNGGYCLYENSVSPWKYDANYMKYADSYSPVLKSFFYKSLTDTIFSKRDECMDHNVMPCFRESLFYVEDTLLFEGEGFVSDTSVGEKDGWLVWVVTDSMNVNEDTAHYTLNAFKKKISIENGKELYEIEIPTISKAVCGGVFVVPVFDAIGKITFQLCGVIFKNEEKWYVKDLRSKESAPQKLPQQPVLTPADPDLDYDLPTEKR